MPHSIDAEVRLGMHDGIEAWWRVRQFPHDLSIENGHALVPRGLAGENAELVGRSFARPAEERSFGRDGATVRVALDQGFGPWRTPRYAKWDRFGEAADQQLRQIERFNAMVEARGRAMWS